MFNGLKQKYKYYLGRSSMNMHVMYKTAIMWRMEAKGHYMVIAFLYYTWNVEFWVPGWLWKIKHACPEEPITFMQKDTVKKT